MSILLFGGFPGNPAGKESACNAGDLDLIPESGRFPWRRERLLTSAFLSGTSMDREAYQTESDMTEQLTLSLS